jgi:hypothetical protein
MTRFFTIILLSKKLKILPCTNQIQVLFPGYETTPGNRVQGSNLGPRRPQARCQDEKRTGHPRSYSSSLQSSILPPHRKRKRKNKKDSLWKTRCQFHGCCAGHALSPLTSQLTGCLHLDSPLSSPLPLFSSPDRKLRRVPPRVVPSGGASQHSNCNSQ